METFGARVVESPSPTTQVGRALLARYSESGGSLGCAISEAVETAVSYTHLSVFFITSEAFR